jgi:hypothetical protein
MTTNENNVLYTRHTMTPVSVPQSEVLHVVVSVPDMLQLKRPRETIQSNRRMVLKTRDSVGERLPQQWRAAVKARLRKVRKQVAMI